MGQRRSKIEMLALDEKIRPLYEKGLGCRLVGEALGEHPVIILKRVRRMGIVRDVEEAEAITVPDVKVPFSRQPETKHLRAAALGKAINWFLERKYGTSLPVEPLKYDLVVDSDSGLKRVQVKSTSAKGRYGGWTVGITRNEYDTEAIPNAGGKFRKVSYEKGEIDFFFIVTRDEEIYLIPLDAVLGKQNLNLNKYEKYKVNAAIDLLGRSRQNERLDSEGSNLSDGTKMNGDVL